LKKIPETDAIFERLAELNPAADADETVLRLSIDAKATIPLGLFSRDGYSRLTVKALDHDFRAEQTLTPVGIFLPQYNQLYLYLTTGPVTADLLVDCLHDTWLMVEDDFPKVRTLLLNLDNGPENHSRRTQFMHRLTQLADTSGLTLQLAYYPPYHSKYNPIERVWGVLEQHWNGSLLDSIPTVFNFAQTMTYNAVRPVVDMVETLYHTGVKLTKQAMAILEHRLERFSGLEKYFVRITPLCLP
jgi:transposase